MTDMINGNMMLTGYHHDVDQDAKTTTFDGWIQVEGQELPLEVHIELTARGTSGDISPVVSCNRAEPIMFMLMPSSVQERILADAHLDAPEAEPDIVSDIEVTD